MKLLKLKSYNLLFYFFFSLIFMEFILRITTVKSVLSYGYFISLLFNLSFAAALFFILSFFAKKLLKHAISVIFLIILAIIYSSQIIYYQFFRTFYHLYSAGNAGQVSDFWKDILLVTGNNFHWVILVFSPALIFFFLGRKIIPKKSINHKLKVLIVLLIIGSHLTGLLAVYRGGKYTNSPYDLYFKNSNPLLSVQNLGLLTTIRLDFQRIVTNWTPTVDVFIPDPVNNRDNDPDDNDDDPKKKEYNVLNIDFNYLIENEKDETIKLMHQYFQSLQPTAKNEYTGKFQGYNLILITAESLAPYAVNKEITPTLYKLVHEGFYFPNFYVPLWDVSTSDGEYMGLTSLIPKSGVWSFRASSEISLPFVMGNQLKKLGYKTVAYHNHTYTYYGRHLSHPNMGYEYKGIGNGLNVKKVWPASDLEMMEVTVDEYIHNEPFHAYYMTVSGHLQYNFIGNSMAMKNRKLVEHLPLSTQAKAYLATQIELDKALEYLLSRLEKAGIAERTLIVMSTDHYPYGLDHDTIDELSGFYVDRDFDIHKSPLIMYVKGMEGQRIDDPVWGIDIIPTISNLMGLEYDSRLLMGRDIFSDSEPLVFFRNMSFITDKGRYNARTKKFFPNEGVEVDDDYVERISRIIQNKIYFSRLILEKDYYSKVLQGIK